jgi:hypothetical protein
MSVGVAILLVRPYKELDVFYNCASLEQQKSHFSFSTSDKMFIASPRFFIFVAKRKKVEFNGGI